MSDPEGFLFVGIPCIITIVSLVVYLFKSDHPFQSKKSYEKELEDYRIAEEERRDKLNKKYPTIVSRLSKFFCMSEEEIKDELRRIIKDDND